MTTVSHRDTRSHSHKAAQPAPSPAVSQQPTEAAKRIKRLVFQALEDGYDDVVKRYRPGWDDNRVADETKASPEFVRKVREEDFGPIKPPSEIEALETQIYDLLNKAEALSEELIQTKKRNGWA